MWKDERKIYVYQAKETDTQSDICMYLQWKHLLALIDASLLFSVLLLPGPLC